MPSNTKLRNVTLCGPEWGPANTLRPFWEITVGAPYVFEDPPLGIEEDKIHPLRSLVIDNKARAEKDGFRKPRLMSAHVIAGHSGGSYETEFFNESNAAYEYLGRDHPPGFQSLVPPSLGVGVYYEYEVHEKLQVRLQAGKPTDAQSKRRWKYWPNPKKLLTTPAYFLTGNARKEGETIKAPQQAEFQHIIGSPMLERGKDWPQEEGEIDLPSLRLVAGAINLAVADGGLDWLKGLAPPAVGKPSTSTVIQRYNMRLVPDGIELELDAPFPGQVAPLRGCFLLAPESDALVLTLLPEKLTTDQATEWRRAWQEALPDEAKVEALHGFRLGGNRNALPAFRWRAEVKQSVIQPLVAVVEVPVESLRMNLISPRGADGVDGVVNVGGSGFFILTTLKRAQQDESVAKRLCGSLADLMAFGKGLDAGTLLFGRDEADVNAKYVMSLLAGGTTAAAGQLDVSLDMPANTPYPCSHNEYRLAQVLRESYGLETPASGEQALTPAPLYGFVPMVDGWLQMPVPNLPPVNPESDTKLLAAPIDTSKNALDGYLRFSQNAKLPDVLSGFEPPTDALVEAAPWSVTVESASGLRVVIAVGKRGGGTRGEPVRGLARVDEPELSTRGLLWLSADCPDHLEALPRMGAGPAAFLDVPMERQDSKATFAFAIALSKLQLKAIATKGSAIVTREALSLKIERSKQGKGRPSVYWRRHPQMPLAAAMPMTRSATSAVRPLESRDLIPFTMVATADTGGVQALAELSWAGAAAVYPVLEGSWHYKVVDEWTWPGDNLIAHPNTVRGVGLFALGVPGVEVRMDGGGDGAVAADPWAPLQAALRYDLPALDEAFATATMPPSPDEASVPQRPRSGPAPTALDWPGLKFFWGEQERRLQLARVAHSYLSDYKSAGDVNPVDVTSMIRGFTWKIPLGFNLPPAKAALPYGSIILNVEEQSGNKALTGFDGMLPMPGSAEGIKVVGYSPASFSINGYLYDARGYGAGAMTQPMDGLWRPLEALTPQADQRPPQGRITRLEPIDVRASQTDTASALFSFWFKDIPLDDKGEFDDLDDPAVSVTSRAWQDGPLMYTSAEWRLIGPAVAGRDPGIDRIDFHGLQLEPLRLQKISFEWDGAKSQPTSAQPLAFTILARMHIGPVPQTDHGGNNLVQLQFKQATGVVWLEGISIFEAPGFSLPVQVNGQRMALGIGRIDWADGVLGLQDASMSFNFLEQETRLDNVTLEHHDAGWIAVWARPQAALAARNIGYASISIEHAVLVVEPSTTSFDLTHRSAVTPGPAAGKAAVANDAVEVNVVESWRDSRHFGDARLRLLGVNVGVDYKPERGGFRVTANSAAADATLLSGFPSGGFLSFGMVASAELNGNQWMADGSARLVAGRFAGSLGCFTDSACMELERIDFEASCSERGEAGAFGEWNGVMTLYGVITVRSAIGWPGVTGLTDGIPFPDRHLKTGCIEVKVDTATTRMHDVQWLLDGHRLPFAIAHGISEGDAKALWTVPVLASHKLSLMGGGEAATPIVFTSVETIAVGAIAGIVPQWKASDEVKNQGSTFVPRYKYPAAATRDSPMAAIAGAVNAGESTIGTALQGALSAGFRTALYGKRPDGTQPVIDPKSLAISGGFMGMLAPAKSNGDAVLMKLPVLAGLSDESPLYVQKGHEPFFLQTSKGKSISISWPDSTVAARVALTSRSAATPRDSTELSLLEAAGASVSDIVMEALVEQSFPVKLPDEGLNETAYFLSAAISVARTIESCKEQSVAPVALSLIAGDKRAAALLVSHRTGDLAPHIAAPRAELMIAGDDMVTQAWTVPATKSVEAYAGIVAGGAYTAHARPRVAVLRDADGAFYGMDLPLRTLRPRQHQARKLAFEDSSRGYPLALGGNTGDWLGGAHEGATAAVRDRESNIPGMSRVARLPAHAASMEVTADTPQPLNELVWLGQQRVPVYLPLQTSKLQSPPIPWLVPGAPRTRLPVFTNVDSALRPLGVLKPMGAEKGVSRTWQPYVPSEAMTAAISDRPGILMVRRQRLEKAITDPDVKWSADFDPESGTYGRPAQASVSQPRTERTPRPGTLPPNTHEKIEYWRRPCASPMLPMVPLRALVGPADVVRGSLLQKVDKDLVARQWSVTFIAAPSTAGMVTASWDGTLEVLAEIDISPAPITGTVSWKEWLVKLVCGAPGEMTATLILGRASIPFRALHIRDETDIGTPDAPAVRRGHVRLVLDARDIPGASAGPAIRAIADALSGAEGVPRAELRWTVRPFAGTVKEDFVRAAASITLGEAKGAEIAWGVDRAPTTLSIALSPVLRGRGALPLEPSSLLFIDPAYDAGLAGPPVEDAKRLQIPATPTEEQPLPKGRGDLMFILACDRQRANRNATLTLMADMRFERPLEARARAQLAEDLAPDPAPDGDLASDGHPELPFTIRVQPRAGEMRELSLGTVEPGAKPGVTEKGAVLRSLKLKLAVVHEIPFANLLEGDGTPAQLAAGDILEIVAQCPAGPLKVLDAGLATEPGKPAGNPWMKPVAKLYADSPPTRTIRVILTDEPVIEPPPASYAALVRSPAVDSAGGEFMLSLPLYAQSPLPHRVDLQNAKADFRAGLLRRNATFIWTLTRSRAETDALQVHIVKSDRNGQTYLPESEKDFVQPDRSKSMSTLYQVPGIIEVLPQPTPNACWATAFTMMKAWKAQASYDIAKAVATAGPKYSEYFAKDTGLPAIEFGAFLSAAGVSHQAQINLSVQGWVNQLKDHGLTWVGTMNSVSPPAGLHSRIVEGMEGDGSASGTLMKIIDPDGGKRYLETFTSFVRKYEDAFNTSHDDQYFQIRFFD
ncbi:papain-like cysteine protease family protein [Nitrosospira sp. Nsp13]|uniref:papain-like cysteine protease family protein n=1 Tax=Nitrosospira sp. Nsp13 TaxID=1855332 RepID=UPI00087E0664|nr:papain-like cysteine protease family protein [Nitrosospira sp. Nsp13]SCX87794.1 Papain-like cysteine protease AvrRpt2 [Nitrosospira sp. Nsp13]